MTYLLTFACYGSHLPGARDGIVNRHQSRRTDPFVEISPQLEQAASTAMTHPPYILDLARAQTVLKALRTTADYRGWHVYAAHVRSNHAHVVIEGNATPERMLNDLKAYASRRLNEWESGDIKRWARHGSTRYLTTGGSLSAAINYVLDEQGEPMAVFPVRNALRSPPSRSGFVGYE